MKEFRDVIYVKYGLKRGDFKKAVEDAMLDYISSRSKSSSARDFVRRKKREIRNNHILMKRFVAPNHVKS
ncbi:MAG: hypothetical protein ACREAG_08510 [Nitrosopumilaceae archaeon]